MVRFNMKKIVLVLGIASVMTLLAGCSDDKAEIEQYKATFINSCIKASGDPDGETKAAVSAICGCAYDKTIEKYGIKEFKRIDEELTKTGKASSGFEQDMLGFVQQCTISTR